ncbi:MAG: addiction module protein [Gemmatimonadetes bacterium]|nr:addiction module protein [Gemmatimonadota bacterium]
MADDVSRTLDELRQEALKLPLLERLELAEVLFDSVDAEDEYARSTDAETAWAEEIKNRVEELDAGTAESSPVADVFERVRAQLNQITNAQAQLR